MLLPLVEYLPLPVRKTPPRPVSSIKVNPGVSCQQLDDHLSGTTTFHPCCEHRWCLAIMLVFLVQSESCQAWVAEHQLQPLNVVSIHNSLIHCTPTTFVHNVHIYAWNIEQQLQRLIVFPLISKMQCRPVLIILLVDINVCSAENESHR